MTRSGEDAAAETDVHLRVARLARTIHGSSGVPLEVGSVLRLVTGFCVESVPGVDHAGVTLVRKRHRAGPPDLESTAETGPVPRVFDELQHEHGDGPCIEAIWSHRSVIIDDTTSETRWPRLLAAVREQTPIRSVFALQLYVDDLELGALNLHSERPHAFDPETRELATTVAIHAAIALSAARRSEQFSSALASRDIISQAKGMIMERYDVDADHAFDILRRLSQESNTPLSDIAGQLVRVDHASLDRTKD